MNHFISLQEAAQMTATYRQNREQILGTAYRNQNILPLAESFDRAAFDQLLQKPGCVGLRIYYGMNTQYQVHAVIVAYDQNNADMLPSSSSLTETEEEDILERGLRCPEQCPPDSELNS